jgi:hypothetical protein
MYGYLRDVSAFVVPLLAGLLFGLSVVTAEAATYYVSNDGDDGDSGLTTGLPWQTIAKVNSYSESPGFLPGDSILFKRGDIWREMLLASSSGISGSVITYGAYGTGAKPIISAADVSTTWASLGASELPGGIFGSGFETGTTSDFNAITVSGTNTLAVTTNIPHEGNYSLEGTFSGVTTDRNLRVNKTIATSSDVYTRGYFYFDPAFDISATSTRLDILLLRQDTTVTRARVSLLKHTNGTFYVQGTILTPSTNIFYAGTPGEIVRGQWYAIELRYKGGDGATGGAELWLDNVSLGSNYTFDTSGLDIARVEVGAHSSSLTSPTAGSKMYIDDIKIATSTVGLFVPEGDDDIYKRSGFVTNVRQVFADDVSLLPVASFGALTDDSFYNDVAAGAVYLALASNGDPNDMVIETGRRQAAASVTNRNYIAFDNLSFRANNTVSFGALSISGGTNIVITECEFLNNYGSGLEFANGASNNRVSSSTFAANDRDFGGAVRIETNSNDNIVEGNIMSGIINGERAGNGVNIRGNVSSSSRNIIRYNRIHDMRDSGVYITSNANYNEVYGNVIYGIDDTTAGAQGGNGIHIANLTSTSTFSHHNIVHHNVVYDVASHGITLREGTYSNLVYNNSIYNVGVNRGAVSGNVASGSGIDLHSSSDTNATGPKDNRVFNNVVSTCATRCLNVDEYAVAVGGNVVDYNLYDNASNTLIKWGATSYTSLATYSAATNQDTHSIQAVPQYTDADDGDLRLLSTSPAINVGTSTLGSSYKMAFSETTDIPDTLGLVDQDLHGAQWEMGAYAFTGAVVVTPPSSGGGGGGGGKKKTKNVTVTTGSSTATTTDPLILALEARILELQQILASLLGARNAAVVGYNFERNLAVGMTGPDVLMLQQFLNKYGFIIAQTGPGSVGFETDYFGEKTAVALARYQQVNNLSPAVGYFGPLTRNHILYGRN